MLSANPYALLIKYGLIALAILAFCAGLVFYGAHLKQNEWDASLTQQALKSADQTIKQAENTAEVEVRYIKVQGATEIRTHVVEKEVIRYVEGPAKKCLLDPEFVRTFDAISWMHDPATIGLPSPRASTGELAQSGGPIIADAQILFAYEHAVVELHELWNTYAALVEWVRTSHELSHEGM